MPKSKYKGRGKVLRYRTLKLSPRKYIHIAIVSRRGKRGGYTISGRVHKKMNLHNHMNLKFRGLKKHI